MPWHRVYYEMLNVLTTEACVVLSSEVASKRITRYQSDYIPHIGMTMVFPHIVSITTAVIPPEYLNALPVYILEKSLSQEEIFLHSSVFFLS